MSSAVHLNRAKEQIACKGFIQCIKHTAAQSKLSVPLFFNLRNRSSMEQGTGHSKQRLGFGKTLEGVDAGRLYHEAPQNGLYPPVFLLRNLSIL